MTFIDIFKGFKLPVRFGIAVMLFLVCLICYMARVNFTIIIISMVKHGNSTNPTDKEDDVKYYNWTNYEQGVLLGAYFMGYLLSSIPGGILAERFGGNVTAGWASIISALLTMLSPFAPDIHFLAMYIVRFIIGVVGGFIYPSCHSLISRWAPPNEKGKFVASLMGGTLGTVVTWTTCGLILEYLNWEWAFIITGAICFIIAGIWFIVVSDSPEKHKFITETEKNYIMETLTGAHSKKKSIPPYGEMAKTMPFWALLFLHYGNTWGLYFFITAVPLYMSKALKFKLSAAGALSSLPNLARLVSAFIFGCIGDYVRSKEHFSVTAIRKFFCLFSHILPGILLVVLGFYGKEPYFCVAIITLSLGFNGAATITNLQNSQDLTPNYAGGLYGLINCVGTTGGIISPLIVAYFTKDNETTEGWKYVFLIGAAIYIIPAIFYFIFGSGKVQKWNYPKGEEEREAKNEA